MTKKLSANEKEYRKVWGKDQRWKQGRVGPEWCPIHFTAYVKGIGCLHCTGKLEEYLAKDPITHNRKN